jgi:exopolysaccharide production protein ExoQ
MPPSLALLLWFIFLAALLRFDPAKDSKTSVALWVPVIWMSIAGSRLPSQWLGGGMGQTSDALEQGNSLDRTSYSVLIILAIGVLMSRSFKWGEFFRRNFALTAFLSFALFSIFWADYPYIAFKRWFRDLGDCVVVLVVLSDIRPLEAVRAVLRRLCYLLIPLSVVFIKYYPELGIHYSFWSGAPEYVGVATSKNMLGSLCLVSGLTFFWDTATRWSERNSRRTKRIILVNVMLLGMTLWLVNLSSSATSRVCLVLGCLVITAAHSKLFRRHPGFLKAMIPASFFLYLILALGFGINDDLTAAAGRDSTFTGRTVIWNAALSMGTNPLVGTGYENFWLGPRLLKVWAQTGPGINEAHNGCLDVYLNLGLIGLFLLLGFLIAGYRTTCEEFERLSSLGSLGSATWIIVMFASVSEAVFKGGLIWMMLLLGAVVVPRVPRVRGASPGKASSGLIVLV